MKARRGRAVRGIRQKGLLMKSWLKTAALAALVCGAFSLLNVRSAEAGRYVVRSYYAGPYYAGTAVEYRRPFTPFYAPRTVMYAPPGPVYGVPVYGGPVYAPPVYGYGVPTVTNYPGVTTFYGAPVAPLPVPAVVYPLPRVVYPPAVFAF